MVINVFIAVVTNNLESAKEEERQRQDEQGPDRVLLRRMAQMREQLLSLRVNSAQGRPPAVYNSGENSRAEDSTRRCQKGARRASRKWYDTARDKSV